MYGECIRATWMAIVLHNKFGVCFKSCDKQINGFQGLVIVWLSSEDVDGRLTWTLRFTQGKQLAPVFCFCKLFFFIKIIVIWHSDYDNNENIIW